MTSYHFYEGKKNDIDKILELLEEFGKEFPSLGYPSFDMNKIKSRVLYFMQHGKILLINDLNKNKLVGLAILHQTEFIWSTEQLMNIQTMFVLKEYRSFELFNQIIKIIKNQAKELPIHMSISTKLIADKLMERVGFEKMGNSWRLS